MARLISHIYHTNEFRQYCHVGNTAQHCRLGLLFQDSDFAGDFEDSKSISGDILCIFWKPNISRMCQKQTSISHSSTESEIISLDAGLRMDGLLAVDLWDVVIEVLLSTSSAETPTNPASGNRCETGNCSRNHKSKPKQKRNRDVEQFVPCGPRSDKHILLKASPTCTALKTMKQ